jgi:hypothetical protein
LRGVTKIVAVVSSALAVLARLRDRVAVHARSRRGQAILTGSLIAVLLTVGVVDQGHPAASKSSAAGNEELAALGPLDILAERSPGERGTGPLLSTKPDERVLSEVRDRPTPGTAPEAGEPVFGAAPGATDPSGAAPPAAGPPNDAGVPGDDFGNPGFVNGPAGFAPSGPTGGVFPVADSPTGVGAVPEPSTWAFLILGFGFVGTRLRRAPKAKKSAGKALPGQCVNHGQAVEIVLPN